MGGRGQRSKLPLILGGVGVLAVVGIIVAIAMSGGEEGPERFVRPTTPEEAAAAFEKIWAQPNLDWMDDLFIKKLDARGAGQVLVRLEERNWRGEERPEITAHIIGEDEKGRLQIQFVLPKGKIRTVWVPDDEGLYLRYIYFPDVEVADPALEMKRFQEAFAARDLETLTGFWPEYKREEGHQKLETLLAGLGEGADAVKIAKAEIDETKDTRLTLSLTVPAGTVEVFFKFAGGAWILNGFKSPAN